MPQKRIQLTLFIPGDQSGVIEDIRKTFNPLQYALIKSHVTLCREDELTDIEKIKQTLAGLQHKYISTEPGNATRFADGKGILIPLTGDNAAFHDLRKLVLQDITGDPRKHDPHITLVHPRNSTCTDLIFNQVSAIPLPEKIIFKKISLIEQANENKWITLAEYNLVE